MLQQYLYYLYGCRLYHNPITHIYFNAPFKKNGIPAAANRQYAIPVFRAINNLSFLGSNTTTTLL